MTGGVRSLCKGEAGQRWNLYLTAVNSESHGEEGGEQGYGKHGHCR